MYKSFFLLLPFFILPLFGFGQTSVAGQIIDADSELPLPYVNVGLVDLNLGTISDEQGFFEFDVPSGVDGSARLRFSMIGFQTQEYSLNDYLDQDVFSVSMSEETTALDEVVVSSQRTKFETKILGNKTRSQMIYAAFTTNRLGNEMGFVVRQRKRPMILKKFNISIVQNDFFPLRFRLNFYNLKNGLPNETLLKENIIIETDIDSGIVTKDLNPYEIVIDEDFFVAIEWIEDLGPGNLFFSGGFFWIPFDRPRSQSGNMGQSGRCQYGHECRKVLIFS